MAFVPVLSFVLLLLFGSVNTWAGCRQTSTNYLTGRGSCNVGRGLGSMCAGTLTFNIGCSAQCDVVAAFGDGSGHCVATGVTQVNCHYWGTNNGYAFVGQFKVCDTQRDADSLKCEQDLLKYWDSAAGECKDFVPDTSYFCENAGVQDAWTGGYPMRANIVTCIDGDCNTTSSLSGSCQDWGFCPDGVTSCEVSKDSTGRRPCARSGSGTTSTTVCYYQCVDGRQLRCRPTSTQYVAGSIYVGTCPDRPPESCDPAPNFSSSSVASSSGSGNSSGSGSGGSSGSGSPWPPSSSGSGSGDGQNYWPILIALHDTLHTANVQRGALEDYAAQISPVVESIESNTFNTWRTDNQINNRLLSLQENGVKIEKSSKKSIDSSVTLLDEINRYLRHDSLVVYSHDTSYNPLLRDIRTAIEEQTDSVGNIKPTLKEWFDKYYGDSVQSNGYVGQKLTQITNSLESKRDSALNADCNGYNGCLAVYKDLAYCKRVWGVSVTDCNVAGTPFDNIWNVESDILSTLIDAVWGDDSTELAPVAPVDTAPLPRTPAEDSARNSIKNANDSIDLPSIGRTLDSMRARIDSVKTKKDSVKIDVDSTMMDSSEAARYVQNILLPSGTGSECFVCHADLGTFGGLTPDGLAIHIDFSSFGGYNWCDLGRAIIKVMTLVICISLTLGSWAAAFGYSPKNDA